MLLRRIRSQYSLESIFSHLLLFERTRQTVYFPPVFLERNALFIDFLFISLVYPNGLNLRPAEFPRDNFFTGWVGSLYRTDTPTNVFPSIHVYNSVVACIAVRRCESLRKRRGIQISSFVLSVLIILSTVFLKQHSVSDVISAFVLNFVVYAVIYRPDWLFSRSKKKIADAEREMPVN